MRSQSIATLQVLRALLDDVGGPHYGLDLIRRSGVKSGTLYPVLYRLETAGWVVGEWEGIDEAAEGRRRRRYYELTGEGERLARRDLALAAALAPPQMGRELVRPVPGLT